MHEHGARSQDAQAIERENLLTSRRVRAFRGVNHEGLDACGSPITGAEVRAVLDGVRPPQLAHDTHGEARVENGRLVRVMMAHRGHTANEVLEAAPVKPHGFRYAAVIAHGRLVRTIDIAGPGRGVWVWAPAQAGEQIELKMIVRVYKAGQQNVAREIERILPSGRAKLPNRAPSDFDIELRGLPGADRNPRAAENHGARRRNRAVTIAGKAHASANIAPFPAFSNSGRSGSPNRNSRSSTRQSPSLARSARA